MTLLNDPLYLGLRRSRIRGKEYDDFVEEFCTIVRECYKDAFLHFEDFGVTNAGRILSKFRSKQSCFNDDMVSRRNAEMVRHRTDALRPAAARNRCCCALRSDECLQGHGRRA